MLKCLCNVWCWSNAPDGRTTLPPTRAITYQSVGPCSTALVRLDHSAPVLLGGVVATAPGLLEAYEVAPGHGHEMVEMCQKKGGLDPTALKRQCKP